MVGWTEALAKRGGGVDLVAMAVEKGLPASAQGTNGRSMMNEHLLTPRTHAHTTLGSLVGTTRNRVGRLYSLGQLFFRPGF